MKSNFTKNKLFSGLKMLLVAVSALTLTQGFSQTTAFNYTGSLQYYTVPAGVTSIRIDAQGAQGGSITIACAATGGLGARMVGDVAVTPGEVLEVLVGGQGQTQGEDGGGGGGSFVVRTGNVPLVIAGGGGGATNNIQICTGLRNGVDASITTSGTASANGLIAGGTGGNGGGANVGSGCGGGGFYTDGGSSANFNGRGRAYVNGGAGGTGQNNNHGGYGGGGCGWYNGGNGGGGGGYSGGGTDGNYPSTYFGGGGGGGSYNIGTNQTNTAGFKTGNGLVNITVLTVAGSTLNFDGTSDYVSIGSPIPNASSYTKEAWIYVTNASAARNIVSSANSPFYVNTGVVNAGQGGVYNYVIDPSPVALSTWVHYAITYDAATTTMMMYKNGVLVSTNNSVAPYVSEPTYIGSHYGSGSFFEGNMDEVRIWNRALCQAEIQNNMNCEIATTGSGLITNYHFNQGVAAGANAGVTTLTDATGNGFNGTMNSFTLTGATSNWIAPGAVTTGNTCAAFANAVAGTVSAQTNVTCNGGNNGSASVAATGLAPFNYAWSPSGGTAATATGLTAGTYTCTISNLCGGTNTVTVTITQPSALVAAAASQTNISCNTGINGAAAVSVTGGTGSYTYDWTPGTPTGDGTANVTGLAAGVYTCNVTDASGCTTTQTFNITEPAVLTSSISATSILCNGGSAIVTVVASGGTAPYTGTGTSTVTAFSYSYVVVDANGCTSTSTITVTEPPVLTATSTATSILCNGGTATVSVVAAGGTSPYSGDGNFSAPAGNSSYTVTDANGCTSTTSITLTEPTAISSSVTQVDVSCFGGNDGSIDLTVSGGTAPYTFDWNSGAFTTEDLSGIPAGTYTGVITDANGCTNGGTVAITEPTALTAIITSASNPTTCGGTDGTMDITVSGGTPTYSYSWNTSATTEDISGVPAGSYLNTITDANGCTTTVGTDLTDPNPPTVALTLNTSTVCIADGAFTLNGGSPAGGTYSGTAVSSGSFNPSAATLGANTVTYSYTDPNTGCSATATAVVTVNACTSINEASADNNFMVMPNPNNGTFMLQLNTTSAADVMIYDTIGQLVSSQKVQANVQQQVKLENSGIYMIVVVTADGQRTTQRVVVSK